MTGALSMDSTFVTVAVFCVLFLFLILFVINFMNHFLFHYKCPYIVRDAEVDGIYPTLILIYISICAFILCLLLAAPPYTHSDYEDDHDHFLDSGPFSSCSTEYTVYTHTPSTSSLTTDSLQSLQQLAIPILLAILFIVETYFAFSRFYNVRAVTHSQCSASIPFFLYFLCFTVCFWCSLTILPLLTPFLALFHVVSNCYFSYYFYQTIRTSYIITNTARFALDSDTKSAIASVRAISILSSMSSIVSAISWCSVILCAFIQCLPITLTLNCLLLYGMFTKNRIFIDGVIHCNKYTVSSMVKAPCLPLRRRRASRKWMTKSRRLRQKSLFGRLQEISANKRSNLRVWTKSVRVMSNSALHTNHCKSTHHSRALHNSMAISPRGQHTIGTINTMHGGGGGGETRSIDMTLPVEEDIDPDDSILNEDIQTIFDGDHETADHDDHRLENIASDHRQSQTHQFAVHSSSKLNQFGDPDPVPVPVRDHKVRNEKIHSFSAGPFVANDMNDRQRNGTVTTFSDGKWLDQRLSSLYSQQIPMFDRNISNVSEDLHSETMSDLYHRMSTFGPAVRETSSILQEIHKLELELKNGCGPLAEDRPLEEEEESATIAVANGDELDDDVDDHHDLVIDIGGVGGIGGGGMRRTQQHQSGETPFGTHIALQLMQNSTTTPTRDDHELNGNGNGRGIAVSVHDENNNVTHPSTPATPATPHHGNGSKNKLHLLVDHMSDPRMYATNAFDIGQSKTAPNSPDQDTEELDRAQTLSRTPRPRGSIKKRRSKVMKQKLLSLHKHGHSSDKQREDTLSPQNALSKFHQSRSHLLSSKMNGSSMERESSVLREAEHFERMKRWHRSRSTPCPLKEPPLIPSAVDVDETAPNHMVTALPLSPSEGSLVIHNLEYFYGRSSNPKHAEFRESTPQPLRTSTLRSKTYNQTNHGETMRSPLTPRTQTGRQCHTPSRSILNSFKSMFTGSAGNIDGNTNGKAVAKTSMSQSVEEKVRIGRINAFLKQNGIGTLHSLQQRDEEGFPDTMNIAPKVHSMLFDYASEPNMHFKGNAKAAKVLGV